MLAFEGATRRHRARTALDGLQLELRAGERVALLGPSGAGKTTLLRLAAGADWPSSGSVHTLGQDTSALGGRRLRDLRRQVGVLSQGDSLVDGLRVVHNVAIGRLASWGTLRALASLMRPRELPRLRAALEEVELGERLWDLPATLSGGERQRVAIARLLVQEPRLILADEPAAALDPRLGRDIVQRLLTTATRSGAALVVSLHAVELIDAGFDRVLALRAGRLVHDGPPEDFGQERLRSIFGPTGETLGSA